MYPAADTCPHLSPKERQHFHLIVGTLLYYERALDYSILPALNDVAREQSNPTVSLTRKAKRILDYVATYPTSYLRYYASDMVLHCNSDVTYLVAPQARSCIVGFYHNSMSPTKGKPPLNDGVLVECKTLSNLKWQEVFITRKQFLPYVRY